MYLNKAKNYHFLLIKKKVFRVLQAQSHDTSHKKKQNVYSRGIILHDALAQNKDHNIASVLIFAIATTISMFEVRFQKT
jgi:hypothetical protein